MQEKELPIAKETQEYIDKFNEEKAEPGYFEESFIIDDHIYQDTLSIVFTDELRQSIKDQCKYLGFPKKRAKRYLPKDAGAVVCHVYEKAKYNNTGKTYSGKWIIFDTKCFSEGIVVHECLHLVHCLLGERYLKLSNSTEEAYAYAIQYYYNKVMACWEEVQKQLKNESNKEETEPVSG